MAAKLMTPDEAAALLHMEPRTLVKWARAGYVPAHPLGEGKRRLWRFFEDELLRWIETQKKQAASVNSLPGSRSSVLARSGVRMRA